MFFAGGLLRGRRNTFSPADERKKLERGDPGVARLLAELTAEE